MKYAKEEIPLHPHGGHIGGTGFHAVRGGDLDLCWYRVPPHTSDYSGLPDNICNCEHYGYALAGRVRVRYPDSGAEDILMPNDVYYIPPRHVFVIEEEFECVEFSPSDQLDLIMSKINGNAIKYGYPEAETAQPSQSTDKRAKP